MNKKIKFAEDLNQKRSNNYSMNFKVNNQSELSHQLLNIAQMFESEGKLDKAIALCQASLALNEQELSIKQELDRLSILEAKATKACKHWITEHYLIEHNHKIIYCPIGKNACTLLKNMLLGISDEQENYQNSNLKMHEYIDKNKDKFKLNHFEYLNNPDYFKFIVIRDPFRRLVSTYVDKFVKRRKNKDVHAIPVIKDVYEYLGLETDFDLSITFSQFVDYLLRTDDINLDGHWRPQSFYFAAKLVNFDFIGQFEKLDTVIAYLEQKLKIKIDANVSKHRLDYGDFKSTEKFHNKYPEELSKLPAIPKAPQFYTAELEDKIRQRYAEDITIYQREFDCNLGFINQ